LASRAIPAAAARTTAYSSRPCCGLPEPAVPGGTKLMIGKSILIAGLLSFAVSAAQAGPCNRDGGSGAVPGYKEQTTGIAPSNTNAHPPTAAMDKAAENKATSSQDTQRQMQDKPTAADQPDKVASNAANQGC